MKTLLDTLLRTSVAAAVLTALAASAVAHPRANGARPNAPDVTRVQGATGRIDVRRDRDGAPSIRARSEEDALFGLGYVHAQDRLWQMELQRRIGNGRLAEILGPSALPTDSLFRTVGLARTAAAAFAALSLEERRPFEAYVAGVNAYLRDEASGFHRPPYDQRHAAQFRQIVDLRDPDAARFVVAPGQSGDPDSPHYDDFLQRWQRVEYLTLKKRAGRAAKADDPDDMPLLDQ